MSATELVGSGGLDLEGRRGRGRSVPHLVFKAYFRVVGRQQSRETEQQQDSGIQSLCRGGKGLEWVEEMLGSHQGEVCFELGVGRGGGEQIPFPTRGSRESPSSLHQHFQEAFRFLNLLLPCFPALSAY